jgi:hypothetical protein
MLCAAGYQIQAALPPDLNAELRKLLGSADRTRDDISEEIRVTQERMEELKEQPTRTNEYRLVGLSQKLRRLEDELESLPE